MNSDINKQKLNLADLQPLLVNMTGVRLLVIFSLLLDGPKTLEELQQCFEDIHYPNGKISFDTLRNDLNSMRASGCEIKRCDKQNDNKISLISHPFQIKFDIESAKSLKKMYNKFYKKLSVSQLIKFEKLFKTLSLYAADEKTSEYLRGISIIKNIDKALLKDLITAQKRGSKISFTYKAPNSGRQVIDFLIKGFEIRSKKLYITGYSYTHENVSFLLVSRIASKITYYLENEEIEELNRKVIYELRSFAIKDYHKGEDERILEQDENKILIEYESSNDFKLYQKLLLYGTNCKVISPQIIKENLIKKLEEMKKAYLDG